ncbi:unnamed protein product [Allacma fusca]|uniref:DUF5648 domain-containing protein n=1 Tax=Allacma fusca TaxID=39272 RepID=A0A8J2JHC7_9HEXA|nr:unnamed protein product [Allacma fusca]
MKVFICVAAIFAACICQAPAQERAPVLLELHRYFNTKTGNHFYTIDHSPDYSLQLASWNYKYEGIAGRIFQSPQNDVVPLHRYFNGKDHFYATNFGELGGGRGKYIHERIEGYVFQHPRAGAKPLYRYYNARSGDHFYTTNWAELKGGSGGYAFEKVEAYIFP